MVSHDGVSGGYRWVPGVCRSCSLNDERLMHCCWVSSALYAPAQLVHEVLNSIKSARNARDDDGTTGFLGTSIPPAQWCTNTAQLSYALSIWSNSTGSIFCGFVVQQIEPVEFEHYWPMWPCSELTHSSLVNHLQRRFASVLNVNE